LPPDPVLLAFDTSAAHCAAALLRGDKIIASQCEEMVKGQAERLFPMLDEILTDAGSNWADLTAIGVGIGPGNFTGIRIAVSAARGLAMSLDVPAVGVSSFETCRGALAGDGLAEVVCLPAPRQQVYLQVFNGSEVSDPVLTEITEDALSGVDVPNGVAQITGACAADVAQCLATPYALDVASVTLPVNPAQTIAHLAAQRLKTGQGGTKPAPLYVHPPDAAPASDPPPVILS
jgi:tRNA threonylcarbamoyl adenosine modification protein YeaZ